MTAASSYPGSPEHQALLAAIVSHYQNDPRVLAVAVFGSLSRGNWDRHSDLDLDVVIADDVRLNVTQELHHLCVSLPVESQQTAIIIADGSDAGDVVFESLMQLSVRYHPLATTSPNIVDSLRVLTAKIDPSLILSAGLANRPAQRESFGPLLNRCVRYVAGADVALQRHHVWSAVDMLHRIRELLMEMYALAHGGARALQVFQSEAPSELQARLGRTLPQYDLGLCKTLWNNALRCWNKTWRISPAGKFGSRMFITRCWRRFVPARRNLETAVECPNAGLARRGRRRQELRS